MAHTFRIVSASASSCERRSAMNLFNQGTVISRVTQMNWNGNITREQLPLTSFFN